MLFELVRILTSDNETTMNQLLVICNKMYDSKLQKMTRRRLCVTIKLYSVNKLAYSLFRLFTAKKIEAMKQVACVKNVFFSTSMTSPKLLETFCMLN